MSLTLGSRRVLKSDIEKDIVPLDIIDFSEVQSVYVYHRRLRENDTAIKNFCNFLNHRQLQLDKY